MGATRITEAILGQAAGYASVPVGSWTLDLSGGGGPTATQTVDPMSGSVYTAIVLDAAGAMAPTPAEDDEPTSALHVGTPAVAGSRRTGRR